MRCGVFKFLRLYFGISEKWGPRSGNFGGIRDSRPGTHLVDGTRDPSFTLNSRPEVHANDRETWDIYGR